MARKNSRSAGSRGRFTKRVQRASGRRKSFGNSKNRSGGGNRTGGQTVRVVIEHRNAPAAPTGPLGLVGMKPAGKPKTAKF